MSGLCFSVCRQNVPCRKLQSVFPWQPDWYFKKTRLSVPTYKPHTVFNAGTPTETDWTSVVRVSHRIGATKKMKSELNESLRCCVALLKILITRTQPLRSGHFAAYQRVFTVRILSVIRRQYAETPAHTHANSWLYVVVTITNQHTHTHTHTHTRIFDSQGDTLMVFLMHLFSYKVANPVRC